MSHPLRPGWEGGPEAKPPPRCDREVYRHGELVLVTHSIPAPAFEAFVRSLVARTGQRVDWHYAAGRIVVRALGDVQAVKAALWDAREELERLRS
jgi:hypothetical protein